MRRAQFLGQQQLQADSLAAGTSLAGVLITHCVRCNSCLPVCRSQFLASSNYGLVVMQQTSPAGEGYTQLHLTTSPLLGLMNNPNYTALLGFAQGNLTEASTFAKVHILCRQLAGSFAASTDCHALMSLSQKSQHLPWPGMLTGSLCSHLRKLCL